MKKFNITVDKLIFWCYNKYVNKKTTYGGYNMKAAKKMYKVTYHTERGILSKLHYNYDDAAENFNFWCECFDNDKADGENPVHVTLVEVDYTGSTVLSHYHG